MPNLDWTHRPDNRHSCRVIPQGHSHKAEHTRSFVEEKLMSVLRCLLLGAALVVLVDPVSAQRAAGTGAPASAPRGNVERGRYIVERVAMCGECHSTRDGAGNLIQSTLYMGGAMPVRPPWPNDWALRTPRIKGLPGYSDELAIRLLTLGAIGRDGQQLRPPMPRFRMSAQDAADVIAFLKSLP